MTISPPLRPPTANLPAVTRRTFLKRASLLAGTAGLGLAGYSSFIEPNEIDLRHVEIKIERLPPAFAGFKIAILSDLHFGPYTGEREIGAAIEATNQLRPDMVALLGDFVIRVDPTTGALLPIDPAVDVTPNPDFGRLISSFSQEGIDSRRTVRLRLRITF